MLLGLKPGGPHTQIDQSIMSSVVDAPFSEKCSTTSTDKCNHFTIRGFVSNIRSKDNKIYSPFVSDGEPHNVVDNSFSFKLPNMQVHRFRWWKCNGCIDQDPSSSQGTTSTVAAVVAAQTVRSDDDRSKIFLSGGPSRNPSTSNASQDLHRVGSSSETLRLEVKGSAKGKSHIKEDLMAAPSNTLVSGKGMRSHSQKSPRKHLVQEHSSSQRALNEVNRENASSSQGISPTRISIPGIASSCGHMSSFGQKLTQDNHYSSQRIPMAPLNGCNKGKGTSQYSGSLQGVSIEVPFATANGSSRKLSRDRPWSAQGTSTGSLMGPPRSYSHGKSSSAHKKPKENDVLQFGKRHYAKRTMQPQDNVEGYGVILKDPSNQEGMQKTAITQEADHIKESVSPMSKRMREVASKGKGVANTSSNSEGKNLLAKINQHVNEASSSFGKCRDNNPETCEDIVKAIRPHNMVSAHSVPSLEESSSGESSSGHVDDDDDYKDEDYEEEEEEDEGGRHSRPRRAPKIISLKKVMDKADLQSAQTSMKTGAKLRKRKNRSGDMVYTGLGDSNGSPSGGSKRVASNNIRGENIILSQKKDQIKRTLDKPDSKKNKKLKPSKSYVSSVGSKEKFEPEHCREQRSHKKGAKDKADGSKRRRKRKSELLGTKDRSPTSRKVMQSGHRESEIEQQTVVDPGSTIQMSLQKEKNLKENTADTISSLAPKGDGRDQAMSKGKEKLVDEDEVAEDSVSILGGADKGSTSLANEESQQAGRRGKVMDFDINVPAEEVPMDIVELMAKNQLERTRDDVIDKPIIMQETVRSQSMSLFPTDTMNLYSAGFTRSHPPYEISVRPPADKPWNWLANKAPVRSAIPLSEYSVQSHKSTVSVGYPDGYLSSNARFAGSFSPRCPNQVPVGASYSSLGSTGVNWSCNPLVSRPSDNNILQRGSSFTPYQGARPSSPSNSAMWPPVESAVIQNQLSLGSGLVSQQMFSSDSVRFRRPQNLDLFPQDTQKNSSASCHTSNVKTLSEHPYGFNRHHMVNYLPLNSMGPEDLSSNEIIPALQLLNIMHSSRTPSNRPLAGEVNGNRNLEQYPSPSVLEPGYRQYIKHYTAGPSSQFEPSTNSSGGGSRVPMYETRGVRPTYSAEKPSQNHATLATHHHQLANASMFLGNHSAAEMMISNSPNYHPSQGRRGRFGSSSLSTSQVVDFRSQKPPLPYAYNPNRDQRQVPPISKGQTGCDGPSRWNLEALNSMNNQTRPRNVSSVQSEYPAACPAPSTEVCAVNRNPAEIIDPRERSKFEIKPENLRRSMPMQMFLPDRGREKLVRA